MALPARRDGAPSSPDGQRATSPGDRRGRGGDRRADDRRAGERRAGQAAVLHHRRATDHRLDLAGVDARLQRQAFELLLVPAPVVVDLVEAEAVAPEPEPVVDLVRCPLCEVLHDRLWLFSHVALDHRSAT